MAPGGGSAAGAGALEDEELEPLAHHLKVLGNEKRLHLLQYLTTPHYIQEIASELGIARQSAQAHVDQLVEIGVLQRVRGRRESGPVTDYVVAPERLFRIQEDFGQLGRLEPEVDAEDRVRALTEPLEDGDRAGDTRPVPRLIMVHGMRIGQATALTGGGPWLIGRDPSATLCLDFDPFVSTRHCEVRRTPAGGFELADLYSRNGTRLDFQPIERGQTTALPDGAIVGVGRTLVVLRLP